MLRSVPVPAHAQRNRTVWHAQTADVNASSTTQQHNNVAAVVLVPWMPCPCENTSVTQSTSMRITLTTNFIATQWNKHRWQIYQTAWEQNMRTCHATRHQACRTALVYTLYTTWHTAWCCRHTVDQTHDINQKEPTRDCYRDATREHICITNMNQLLDDPLQPVACTSTSTNDDHNKQ